MTPGKLSEKQVKHLQSILPGASPEIPTAANKPNRSYQHGILRNRLQVVSCSVLCCIVLCRVVVFCRLGLGSISGCFWKVSGRLFGRFGGLGVVLGGLLECLAGLRRLLGGSRGILGASWGVLKPSWDVMSRLGSFLSPRGLMHTRLSAPQGG